MDGLVSRAPGRRMRSQGMDKCRSAKDGKERPYPPTELSVSNVLEIQKGPVCNEAGPLLILDLVLELGLSSG